MKKGVLVAVAAIVVIAAVVMALMAGRGVHDALQLQSNETALENGCGAMRRSRPTDSVAVGRDRRIAPQSQEDEISSEDDSEPEENEEPQTEEEKREAAAEKLVDDFDDLTDKWQEASAKGVTMSDIDDFAKRFRSVPKDRQDECIHRALNLIPDENVMLLAGVLMDKLMNKGIVEAVYHDILNRGEDVKKSILQEIYKDKSHPCWDDTAWILEVTGELPKDK